VPNKPVALVTGANQGIGLQIARTLHCTASRFWLDRAISSAAKPPPRRSDRTPTHFNST
jgi:NAD(P)-dependent dehydrogenase (short-subunit alcohol dehydrogenase family)